MKLVPFTLTNDTKISINPEHVVTVRATSEKQITTVFLVTGGQLNVDGTYEEVTAKLNADDPRA